MGSEMGQKLASLEILLQLLSNKGRKYIIVIILFQSYLLVLLEVLNQAPH